jgi:hypothetical protein
VNDLPFLRRIDLGKLDAFVVEEDLHLVEEELMGVWIRDVETKVIDQLLLFLLPLGPAIFADLRSDLLAQVRRNRRDTERFTFLPAPSAFEFVGSE